MAIQEKLYTVQEFWDIAHLPENENKRLELVHGVICEMPPSSKKNTIIAMLIGHYLTTYVLEHNLGYVSGADGGYELEPHTIRIPDAAFIAKARVTELEGVAFAGPPDLAVEVISSETPRQVLDKTILYLKAGAQIVWNVYPDDKVIDVCRLNAEGSLIIDTLTEEDTLEGSDTLPGFTLTLKRIFAD